VRATTSCCWRQRRTECLNKNLIPAQASPERGRSPCSLPSLAPCGNRWKQPLWFLLPCLPWSWAKRCRGDYAIFGVICKPFESKLLCKRFHDRARTSIRGATLRKRVVARYTCIIIRCDGRRCTGTPMHPKQGAAIELVYFAWGCREAIAAWMWSGGR